LVNGESVDIFVKVVFDPTGWAGNQIEKKTDTHYASKDGRGKHNYNFLNIDIGIFNYRFKFPFETPCDFPRLKFSIYDYGVISDEALGEALLNMKK
jgi:hypothetical protein